MLSQDRKRLIDLGLLLPLEHFQLPDQASFLRQVKEKDRLLLQEMARELGTTRGIELIRKTYLEFPHYASRSQIVAQVLRPDEYERMCQQLKRIEPPELASPGFFTVGYEGITIDAYLDILIEQNISTLIDVRKNPVSMKYGFSKKQLAEYMQAGGISYVHLPELGVPSHLRQDLHSPTAYEELFDHYFTHILPKQTRALEHLKEIAQEQKRVAITCFEADHRFCHRHKVAQYLEQDPTFHLPIIHLHKDCAKRHSSVYNSKESTSRSLWEEISSQ